LRSPFAPHWADLSLLKPFRGAILASKPPGIWRMSDKGTAVIKSTRTLAIVAMLTPGLSAAQSVQNFIIAPDPTLDQTQGAALEKVVDYFTSTTSPSVVNANGQGPGGVFLYTNDGLLTGNWTKYQIGYGDCYEHAEAFKYPGDVYPGVIASCDNQLTWFAN